MIVTLAPKNGDPASLTGHYTAIVRGKNGTTGVALVDVYDLGTCFETGLRAFGSAEFREARAQ